MLDLIENYTWTYTVVAQLWYVLILYVLLYFYSRVVNSFLPITMWQILIHMQQKSIHKYKRKVMMTNFSKVEQKLQQSM